MPYITPQGKPLAYTPQRKARFPYPSQGIPVVAPPVLPVWSMFMHDHYHRGVADVPASVIYFGSGDYNVYALNPDGSLKWIYGTNDCISYASPVIDEEGTIYIGSCDFCLYALNPDGTLKWAFETLDTIEFSAAVDLTTGVIYVPSYDAYLYAINPDGSEKWKYKFFYVIESSPTLYEGDIYVADDYETLYHFSPDSLLVWDIGLGYEWIYISSPAIDAYGNIYIGGGDLCGLSAVNPDGTLKWFFETEGEIEASSSIDSEGIIYFGCWDNYIYAVNPDGTLRWRFPMASYTHSSPAISDGIYIGSNDNKVYALKFDGTLKWAYETGSEVKSSPAIDKNEIVFIGSADYNMYALNPDGTLKWAFATGYCVHSSAAIV